MRGRSPRLSQFLGNASRADSPYTCGADHLATCFSTTPCWASDANYESLVVQPWSYKYKGVRR